MKLSFFENLPISSIYFRNFLSRVNNNLTNFEEMNIMLSTSFVELFSLLLTLH